MRVNEQITLLYCEGHFGLPLMVDTQAGQSCSGLSLQ